MKLDFGYEHNLDHQFLLTSSFWLRKTPNSFVVWLFKTTNAKENRKMHLADKDKKSCPVASELLDRK